MKILVYVDGSEASFRAVERAIQMAREGAEVTALHVSPPRLDRDVVSQFDFEPEDLDANFAKEILDRVGAMFAEARIDPKLDFARGEVAEVICRRAEEEGHDLILFGPRDTRGGRVFDLAEIVKRRSRVPVEVLS